MPIRAAATPGSNSGSDGREQEPGLEAASGRQGRSEEHTSELQSLTTISYAVFCLKKKKKTNIVC